MSDPTDLPDDCGPPTTTSIQRSLAAAGREMAAALAEAGVRMSAAAALGQVMAGLPDAARGIIEHLPVDHVRQIGNACQALDEIAFNATPEGKEVAAENAARAGKELRPAVYAGIYGSVLRDDMDRANARLDEVPTDTLYELRTAALRLTMMIETRLPTDRSETA